MQTVLNYILQRVDEELKPGMVHTAATYVGGYPLLVDGAEHSALQEHRLKTGNKPIFHLEGTFSCLLSMGCERTDAFACSFRGQGHVSVQSTSLFTLVV